MSTTTEVKAKADVKVLMLSIGGGKFEQVKKEDQVKRLTAFTRLNEEQTAEIWKAVYGQKEIKALEDPEVSKKDKGVIKKAVVALEQVLKNHNQEMDRIAEFTRQEELKKAEKVKVWDLALAKGEASALEYVKSGTGAILQSVVGSKFVAKDLGLEVKPGSKIDEADVMFAFKGLLGSHEGTDHIKATIGWELGDLVNFTNENFGAEPAAAMIGHAIDVSGRAKHTVQEAQRLCDFLKEEKGHRRQGLPWTHHQKILNNKGAMEDFCSTKPGDKSAPIDTDKLDSFINDTLDYAQDGPTKVTLVAKNGEKKEVKSHRTVREIDEFIKKRIDPTWVKPDPKPKTGVAQSTETTNNQTVTKEKAKASEVTPPKYQYLYLNMESATFFGSNTLHMKALASESPEFLCMDVITGKEIARDGSELGDVAELEEEFRDAVDVQGTEVKAAEEEAEEVPA